MNRNARKSIQGGDFIEELSYHWILEKIYILWSFLLKSPRTGMKAQRVTSALGRSGWSTPRPGYFTPEKDRVLLVQEARWAPGLHGHGKSHPHLDSIPWPSSP
jgi:hypothetical protein